MSATRLPNDRDVWRIAAPLIISNISVPLLGMVDTGVAGHLDSAAYLGAVALGSTIFTFIYGGMSFLRMGTTGIAAQAFGAEDNAGLRTALGQALVVAIAVALLLIALQWPISGVALRLLSSDAETTALAAEYVRIRIWSAPGTLANFVLIGWFIGRQDARAPLAVFLTINLSNVVLDLLFVPVLGMTVDGIALASVIAEYAGLAVGGTLATRALRRHTGQWPLHRLKNLDAYRAFFSVNANLFVRSMLLLLTLSFVTAWGARLGPLFLAANAVLLNFQLLMSMGLDGVAHAAEALVGKAVGARSRDSLQTAVRLALKWSLWFALAYLLLYAVAGKGIVNLLTDLDDVRETAYRYLPWIVVSPLVSVWSFLYDGVFVGATRAREMRDVMLIAAVCVFLPAWYFTTSLGNDGLWLAFLLFLAARGIGMHLIYRRQIINSIPPAPAG